MDFRKTMELIAANCERYHYCYHYCYYGAGRHKCPMLRVKDNGVMYCMLEAPLTEDVDRICKAAEEIASARAWEREEEE